MTVENAALERQKGSALQEMALRAKRIVALVFREEPAGNQLEHPAPLELYTRCDEIKARSFNTLQGRSQRPTM